MYGPSCLSPPLRVGVTPSRYTALYNTPDDDAHDRYTLHGTPSASRGSRRTARQFDPKANICSRQIRNCGGWVRRADVPDVLSRLSGSPPQTHARNTRQHPTLRHARDGIRQTSSLSAPKAPKAHNGHMHQRHTTERWQRAGRRRRASLSIQSKSAGQSTAARPAQRHVALVSSRTEVQYSPLGSLKVEHRERGGAALNPVLLRHVARDLDGHDEVGRVARGREHAEARRRLVHGAKVEAALGPLAVGDR